MKKFQESGVTLLNNKKEKSFPVLSLILWLVILVAIVVFAYKIIIYDAKVLDFSGLIDNQLVLGYNSRLLLVMAGITIVAAIALILYHVLPAEKKYVLLCFVILGAGLLIAFTSPVVTGYDEYHHLFKTITTLDGNVLIPEDYSYHISDSYILLRDSMGESIYGENFAVPWASSTSIVDGMTNGFIKTTYPFYGYLFGALGMALGKAFGGSVAAVFLGGRVGNVLGYVALVGISFALLPKKTKAFGNAMAVFAAFPGTLYTVSHYTQDGMVYGIALILISLFLRMYYAKEHSVKWEYIAFLALIFLLTPMKYPFILFVVFLFLVPKEKIVFSHVKVINICFSTFLCCYAVAWFFLFNTQFHEMRIENVNNLEQLSYIFFHIPEMILVFFTSFMLDTARFVSDFGIYSTQHSFVLSISVEWMWVLFAGVILAFFSGRYDFGKKRRIGIILQMIGIIVITYAALYVTFTAVGAGRVDGVYGRHLYPLLLFIPFCMPKERYQLIGINKSETAISRMVFCAVTVFLCYYLYGFALFTLG